jgi:purine-binding chemotaxis protein CheW
VHAQFVTLGAAGEVFGAPVDKVQEILDARPISRLPHLPPAMLGIIDVRGRTIPVVDLRHALGFEPADDTAHTRILVMAIDRASGPATLGVRADRVFEVTALDGPLEPPAADAGWAAACVAGIGRRGGGFVTVLDVDVLLRGMDPVAA